MIKNFWYAVLDSKEVKRGKITCAKRFSKNLAFFRDKEGKVGCIERICAHRSADIGTGKIVNDHIQCPFHGLEYDRSGKVILIPANGKNAKVPENFRVKSYIAEDKHGLIWVWYGDESESIPEIEFLEGIDKSFVYDTFIDPWPVHYSRCIENQLDVSHLPFVHYDTIGRGNRTLVNGPKVEYKNYRIKFWVNNVVDDGITKPLTPEEFREENSVVHLEFLFPNVWQNYIDDRIRVFAAFVPVDEDNSLVYIRFYQRFLTVPILEKLVTKLSMPLNRKILHQDRRIVRTQIPKKTGLKMNENLFQADLPIIIYRQKREEFKRLEKNKDN
jgi:phenylpropionate dioxygenase-like ring-hydroxylating dioxygenase large terminal subunit